MSTKSFSDSDVEGEIVAVEVVEESSKVEALEMEESLKKLTLESSNTTQEVSEIKEEEIGEKKFLTLKSSDGEVFKVEEDVILLSETIKQLAEDGCAEDVIPLANVTTHTMAMVIDYCKHHAGEEKSLKEAAELEKWDAQFIDVEQKVVFNVILAANYLNIKGLLDLGCAKVAQIIKGKPVPVIREILGIESGFTEEEEADNRRWNQWAYED